MAIGNNMIQVLNNLIQNVVANTNSPNKNNAERERKAVGKILTQLMGRKPTEAEIEEARGS